jgi:hypothetical protein
MLIWRLEVSLFDSLYACGAFFRIALVHAKFPGVISKTPCAAAIAAAQNPAPYRYMHNTFS